VRAGSNISAVALQVVGGDCKHILSSERMLQRTIAASVQLKRNIGRESQGGRSQWPRGLRYDPSSLTRTLGSWDACVRLFCVCVVLCVGSGHSMG
jgi:hypothetical protein